MKNTISNNETLEEVAGSGPRDVDKLLMNECWPEKCSPAVKEWVNPRAPKIWVNPNIKRSAANLSGALNQ